MTVLSFPSPQSWDAPRLSPKGFTAAERSALLAWAYRAGLVLTLGETEDGVCYADLSDADDEPAWHVASIDGQFVLVDPLGECVGTGSVAEAIKAAEQRGRQ